MVRRRAAFNPLEPSSAPRWYVVRSMHGAIIDSRRLVAEANLTHVFITAMLAWMEGGWTISEFSSTSATFFCTRDLERRMVSIDPTDTRAPQMYGAALLSGGGREYGWAASKVSTLTTTGLVPQSPHPCNEDPTIMTQHSRARQ